MVGTTCFLSDTLVTTAPASVTKIEFWVLIASQSKPNSGRVAAGDSGGALGYTHHPVVSQCERP